MTTHTILFQDYGEVVTVPELAKMLRVGRNTAYDLVSTGQVQSVKVGNQIRIPKASVIDFLQCDHQKPGE
jgi:excisionase family DNA binding protein